MDDSGSGNEVLGEVKELTLGMLKELNETQLVTIAESLSLEVKEEKKSKKEAMRNLILRHLTSEDIEDSADEGLALYKKVAEEVSTVLDAQYQDQKGLQKLKEKVSGEGSKMSKLEMRLKNEVDGDSEAANNVVEQLKGLSGDELLYHLLKLKLESLGGSLVGSFL